MIPGCRAPVTVCLCLGMLNADLPELCSIGAYTGTKTCSGRCITLTSEMVGILGDFERPEVDEADEREEGIESDSELEDITTSLRVLAVSLLEALLLLHSSCTPSRIPLRLRFLEYRDLCSARG